MIKEQLETVIIGAGQAGLAMSYHLNRRGREHVVLERQRVAERWQSARWDSLTFQSPNWNMQLSGFSFRASDPDAFASRDDVVRFIEDYAAFIRGPLRCGLGATAVRQKPGSSRLIVETAEGPLEAKNVVIATGPYQSPAPRISMARSTMQIHSSQYRNPALLPPGAVLVIGSGNSGCQIAEDLCGVGRRVYLSVSQHRRAPRRYRGKDYVWWQKTLGETDAPIEQRQLHQPARLITGVAGGHDIDLRRLAKDGAVLLGHIQGGTESRLAIANDLRDNLARGDDSLRAFVRQADRYVVQAGLDLPLSGELPECLPEPAEVRDPIQALDMVAADISTIIWANGFQYDFGWIDLPVFASWTEAVGKMPVHKRGITNVPGVYFLGLPWLHKYKSALLYGVGEDAENLAEHIARRVRNEDPDIVEWRA